MKTKLKSIITRVVALALTFITGSALAATPTAVIKAADIAAAQWNDGVATINGLTLTLNGNTLNSDGTITIESSATKGVRVDAGSKTISTILVKAKGYAPQSSGNVEVVVAMTKIGESDKSKVGLGAKADKKCWYIWDGTAWGNSHVSSSTFFNDTGSHTYALSYENPAAGQITQGTTMYIDGTRVMQESGLRDSGLTHTSVATIGGTQRTSDTLSKAVGLTIEGIAIFDSSVSSANAAVYDFVFPTRMFSNTLATNAESVPAGTYGDIVVPGNGYKATAYTAATAISPAIGSIDGLIGKPNWTYLFTSTVSGWFKINALPTGADATIYGYTRSGGSCSMRVAVTPEGKLKIGKGKGNNVDTWDSGNRGGSVTTDVDVPINQWFYLTVAGQRKPEQNTGDSKMALTVFINGVQEFAQEDCFLNDGDNGSSNTFVIGAGISAAGLYGDTTAVTDVATIKSWATNEKFVEAAPPKATVTLTEATNWSGIQWGAVAPSADVPAEITFDGGSLSIDKNIECAEIRVKGAAVVSAGAYTFPAIDASMATSLTVNGGTIEFAALPSSNITIAKDAALKFDVSTATTINGIAGAGTFVKTGAAKLTLNNKHGAYAIDGTTLQIDNGEVLLNCGDGDAQAKNATFVIGANGSLTQYGWYNFYGTITFENATDKTVLGANVRANDGLTFVKRGAGKLTFTSGLGSGGNSDGIQGVTVEAGQIHFNNMAVLSPTTLALDFSKLAADATPIDGDFTVSTLTAIRFPAGQEVGVPLTLCTGTLSAPATPVRDTPVYVGDSATPIADAMVLFDAANKMVAYGTPVVVDLLAEDTVDMTKIAEAVNAKVSGWNGSVKVTVKDGAKFSVGGDVNYDEVAFDCAGLLTIVSDSKPDLSKFIFDGVTSLNYSWLAVGSGIAVNFNQGQGKLGDSDEAGIEGLTIYGNTWNNVDSNSSIDAKMFGPDGDAVLADTLPVAFTGSTYSWTTATTPYLKGYLDDSGISFSTIVPFDRYDAYIICATDTDNAQFGYKTINGVNYSADTYGEAVADSTAAWGISHELTPVLGKNVMHIPGLTAKEFKLTASPKVSGSVRGCIAAIVIVKTKEPTVANVDCSPAYSVSTAKSIEGDVINLNFADGGVLTVDEEPTRVYNVIGTGAVTIKGTETHSLSLTDIGLLHAYGDSIKYIFTDATIPEMAPGAGITYRWEGTTALAAIPFVGNTVAGKIEIACPLTSLTGRDDGKITNSKAGIFFDTGFSCEDSKHFVRLGNDGGQTQYFTQRGGELTLDKSGDDGTSTDRALTIAHWSGNVYYDFAGGSINVPNDNTVFGWDGTAHMVIGSEMSTATLTTKGIVTGQTNNPNELTITTNGTLSVGSYGADLKSSTTVTLIGGTLGAFETCTFNIPKGVVVGADSTIFAEEGAVLTFASTISGTGSITKTGAGTLTVNAVAVADANAFIVDAGTLVVGGNAAKNAFTVNENGAVEFAMDVSESGVVEYRPTITKADGEIVIMLTISGDQVRNKTEFALATLATGLTKDDVTVKVINADPGNEVDFESRVDEGVLKANANIIAATHEFTPSASGSFTWTAGGEFGEGIFKDYDNAIFNGSEFATEVTVGSKIEAGTVEIGGDYAFSGSPVIASSVNVTEGAKATFANNLVADALVVNDSTTVVESVTASAVALTNANFKASVLGPSMKYVRLSITATQGAGEKPAVGEFRLYRGNATTGYTIVDWPIGTKIVESTGLKATKETDGYPSEVGAGLGNQGGNECQPGVLIDGYYGNVGTPKIYGGGAYNTPAYNKWWPTSQANGPWVVTIEFPYPVATFSGCNFCLADHEPRNPTAWTIEVSGDGINWTTVNETTSATWSGQHAWAGGDETVPAFLNAGTTPTEVTVGGDTTIVADGSWTADLEIDGNLTLKGVAEKYLTLDAASSSAFANGAKLTFDLSAYSVTKAGKQYVVAGPLEGWPAVNDIKVVPEGRFQVGLDGEGYFVKVVSGNYWLGDEQGVGTWDLGNTAAWGVDEASAERRIWLNGLDAMFVRNGTVTIADATITTPAVKLALENEIEVELAGDLTALAGVPIAFESTNDVLTINNAEAFTPGTITEVTGANGALVKKGAGTLVLTGANTFTGGLTVSEGLVKSFGADVNATATHKSCLGTGMVTIEEGATVDLNGTYPNGVNFTIKGSGIDGNGALVNTGANLTSSPTMGNITLAGDATIGGTGTFYMNGGTLDFGEGYVLTKKGSFDFPLRGNAFLGTGKLVIEEGEFNNNNGNNGSATVDLEIKGDATNRLNGTSLTVRDFKCSGTIEGNSATLKVNGTLFGDVGIPKLQLADGATIDLTTGIITNSSVLTFGSSVTLVLNAAPTATTPVKIAEGEYTEAKLYDTAVTVKVGDETIEGQFLITEGADGAFVAVDPAKYWTGEAEDFVWATEGNWAGGVPGKGDTAFITINGATQLALPEGGVGALAELHIKGTGTITLDATKLANVGAITVEPGVTFTAVAETDVALALQGTGSLVKTGAGTLTLHGCAFTPITVEAGALDFFVDENETLTIAAVISGDGAVKKTGAGLLTLSGANTFAGGTEIAGGTLKAGVAGTATSSAVGTGTLKIGTNATFDINNLAFSTDGLGYVIESAGTITCSTGNAINGYARCVKSLTLTGDTTVTGNYWTIGLGNKAGKTSLVMDGHTLTVKMNNGNNFSIEETEITGGGVIDIQSGCLRTNGGETYADGKIKLNGGSIEINTFEGTGTAMSVKDFEYVSGSFVGNNKLVVTDRVINGRADNKIQLADGATIHNDNGYAIQIGTNWGFDGVAYLDANESVVDGLVSLYKQGIDAALLYWTNAGDAFDPSVIKLSQHLKTELEKRGIALAKDEVNKCLKFTRALGFLIMLK